MYQESETNSTRPSARTSAVLTCRLPLRLCLFDQRLGVDLSPDPATAVGEALATGDDLSFGFGAFECALGDPVDLGGLDDLPGRLAAVGQVPVEPLRRLRHLELPLLSIIG